jgi:hypothetical protein
MNLLLGLPFMLVVWALLVPILFLDGGSGYLRFLWEHPFCVVLVVVSVGVPSDWLARRLSQVLLLRTTGAKLKATHEPP